MRADLRARERPVRGSGRVAFFCFWAGTFASFSGCAPSQKAPNLPAGVKEAPAPTVRELKMRSFLGGGETCFNGWDDNENALIDEGCGVEQGEVQFVIAWVEPKVDVDLYVTDPGGQIAPVDGASDLGLSRSRDCPDEKNACGGQNFENVYLEEDDIPPGKYRLRVRVETIPAELDSVNVALGVRLPDVTRAYEIAFHREGQEILLDFEVARQAKKE